MKKSLILVTIMAFVFTSTGLLFSQQNPEDEKFQKVLDGYLDALWKFYPTAATMAGFHKYDDKLEDLSKKSIEKRHENLDEHNQDFVAKVDRTAMSPEVQIDHEIIVDALDHEIVKHEMTLPWNYNPLFYNEIFLNCVRSLMTGDFGTPNDRAKNAAERLKDLPKLIKQAKENLEAPPQIYTETAILQFPGILNFYKNELPQLIEEAPESQKSKLLSNLSKVIPALEDYQNFLTNVLLPKSTGNFRLSTAHSRLLRVTLKTELPVQDLLARAKADVNNIRREMFLVCIPFYRIMYPEINLEQLTTQRGEEQVRNIVIKGVLDKIKTDHVSKDEFLDAIKNTKEQLKNFITEQQLLDLPENNLEIEPMPLEAQGLSWTRLVRPGAYETSEAYKLQIAPLNNDLTEEQINLLLEEYNNYFIPFYVLRKVYPGQFVPSFFARQNSSLVRKLYPNQAVTLGWPNFLEESIIISGFGNYDLRVRLNQLKYRLKAVIDFQLDLNLHQGGMTEDQAVRLMTITGFQTEAEAKRNWNRIILNPGGAVYTYAGMQEYMEMERAYREKMGDGFDQKEFFKKVLSYGAIPIRHLKMKILE